MYVETGFVCTESLLKLVSKYFKEKWPGAILSLDNGVTKPLEGSITLEDIPVSKALVIYKEQAAHDLMESLGWVEETAEDSILFWHIEKDGGFDISYGEEEDYPWIQELLNNLRLNSLYLDKVRVAA